MSADNILEIAAAESTNVPVQPVIVQGIPAAQNRVEADRAQSSPRWKQTEDGSYVGVDRDTGEQVRVPKFARVCRRNVKHGDPYARFLSTAPVVVRQREIASGDTAHDLRLDADVPVGRLVNEVHVVYCPAGMFDAAQRAFERKGSKLEADTVRRWIAKYINDACRVPWTELKDERDVVLCVENWGFTRTAVDFVLGEDDRRTIFARMVGDKFVILAYPSSMKSLVDAEKREDRDRYWYSMDVVPKTGQKADIAYRNGESDPHDSVLVTLRMTKGGVPRAWAVSEDGKVWSDKRESFGSYAVERKRAKRTRHA